jgi:outer membrane protein assembly factor BamB
VGFDARTGEARWRLAGDSSSLPRELAVAGGAVVGTVGNGPTSEVRVLDAENGTDRWTKPGGASYGGSWAIGDGIVVVTLPGDGSLVAYDLRTGDVRWKRTTNSGFFAHPERIDGTTVIALWENQLAALATADGSPLWVLDQPFGSPLMSATTAVGGLVVVAVNSRPWQD